MSKQSGFASLPENDYIRLQTHEGHTAQKSTRFAVRLLRQYLAEKNLPQDFENISKQELSANLRTFCAELRNSKGELYKRTTVLCARSGIARFLSNLLSVDTINDSQFKSSNDIFTSVCKDLYRQGKGAIDHK